MHSPDDLGAGEGLLQQVVAPACTQWAVDALEIRLVATDVLHDLQADRERLRLVMERLMQVQDP
jgi:hypothetical protein